MFIVSIAFIMFMTVVIVAQLGLSCRHGVGMSCRADMIP